MATGSHQQLNMPGLFTPTPLDERSSSRPHLFEPAPRFSLTSETSGHDLDVHGTRKRSRQGGFDSSTSATQPAPTTYAWGDNSLKHSRYIQARSPPPLAHDRYELAGGMEDMDRFARHNGDYDDYFQLEKQRGMWSVHATPMLEKNHQRPVDGVHLTPNGTKPWMINQLMNIVGGVAGKLFQFCAVPFRGFQAGGGQAYTVDGQGEIAEKLGLGDDPFNDQTTGPTGHPLPGEYPDDNYGVCSIESLENERPRMTKRLRTGDNWVVVDKEGDMISRPSTPRLSERRVPSHTRSPSQIPRPASRAANPTPTGHRPSLIPVSRRSTTDRRSLHGASKVPAKQYSSPRAYSRQSYGSPVMFEDKGKKTKSPLPVESQRLINKMKREELEEDARMRRMSSQMSAMLREAQQALGSKFDIEDEFLDNDDEIEDRDYSRQTGLF